MISFHKIGREPVQADLSKNHKVFYRQEYYKIFNQENIQQTPYAKLYERKKRDVLNFFSKREKGTIVDIGCGFGRLTVSLACMDMKMVIGVDISEKMIKQAKENLERVNEHMNNHDRMKICFVIADAEALPFKKASVDYVLSLDVLSHLLRPFEHLKEMKRITNYGGCLLIDFSNRNPLWIIAYPRFMFGSIYRQIVHGNVFKFFFHGCVSSSGQRIVTHYFKRTIRNFIGELNLSKVACKRYGLIFAPKFYLYFVIKPDTSLEDINVT